MEVHEDSDDLLDIEEMDEEVESDSPHTEIASGTTPEGDEEEPCTPIRGAYVDEYGEHPCTPVRDTCVDGLEDLSETKLPEPTIGMVFPTWEDADKYFWNYGRQNGFGILRRASGSLYICEENPTIKIRRNYTWKCECAEKVDLRRKVNGKKVYPSSDVARSVLKTKKCGCPVMMYCFRLKGGEWEVRKVVSKHEGHNPTPKKAMTVPAFRRENINPWVRRRLELGHSVGEGVGTIHKCLAKERNGVQNMGITKKDLHNIVQRQRRLKMKGGDANAMIKYFKRMSSDNEKFFYRHRKDEDGYLKDMMWVDARSRAAYEEFGDVVSFDSTYLTNSFQLPFANFVGVNHHGQTILLGCALLSHENTETFTWLFKNWLECMGGKCPMGILTDQDPAMRNALVEVMPKAKHRWCLWHILQKFSVKLGAYADYHDMKKNLHNAVYDSLTMEEFEVNWTSAIEAHELSDNDWLVGLYEERRMWVPAFMKDVFWGGMKTTQRSESINSFFNGFLMKDTKLCEFAEKYIDAMEHRAYEESLADGNSYRRSWQAVTGFSTEEIFREVYTGAKVKEVQVQCARALYVTPVEKKQLSDDVVEHTLTDRVWKRCDNSKREILTKRKREYTVTFNVNTKEASCLCKLFECHGIVCRHLIKIYEDMYSLKIPESFILRRWRRDVMRAHTMMKVAYHDPSKTEEVKRQDKMVVGFEPLCIKAAASEELLSIVLEGIRSIDIAINEKISMQQAEQEGDEQRCNQPTAPTTPAPSAIGRSHALSPATLNESTEEVNEVDDMDNDTVLDPLSKKSKKKGRREKSAAEIAIGNKTPAQKGKKNTQKMGKGKGKKGKTPDNFDGPCGGGGPSQTFPLEQGCAAGRNAEFGQFMPWSGTIQSGNVGQYVPGGGCYVLNQPHTPLSMGGVGLATSSGSVGYFTSLMRSTAPQWVINDCVAPYFGFRS